MVGQTDTLKTPAPQRDEPREPLSVDGNPLALLGPEAPWSYSPLPGPPVPCSLADSKPQATVYQLPGLPSSASMFLSALVSVGAWQCLCKARHLDLSHLPAWYHPDAPLQIGHTHAFDPQLGFDVLPVLLFDAPMGEERPVGFRGVRRALRARCGRQSFLAPEAPRGPPLLSS